MIKNNMPSVRTYQISVDYTSVLRGELRLVMRVCTTLLKLKGLAATLPVTLFWARLFCKTKFCAVILLCRDDRQAMYWNHRRCSIFFHPGANANPHPPNARLSPVKMMSGPYVVPYPKLPTGDALPALINGTLTSPPLT
jgi:hypothetical protein